ncbi:MAG: hypothetical protein NZ899_14960 [Thermoguttaceae bacterium]|nr:hypothetical protein [Thermoguttaceae bacterium]MDW8078151.1 hypothetical protein [Thermoguttaceae bacterium]
MRNIFLRGTKWSGRRVYVLYTASVSVVLISATLLFADTIRHSGGTIAGKVIQADAEKVVVDRGQNRQETIEPFRIEFILFDDEPSTLRTAKMAAMAGRYEEALTGLDRVQLPENADPKVRQEIDYLRALCRTRLAEASANPQAMKEAADLLANFVSQNPKHYRVWQAAESAANLLAALGQQQAAEQFLARLSEAPWPQVKLRAQLAAGRAALARKDLPQAEKLFEAVLAGAGDDERLQIAGSLGKVRVLAEQGRADEAVQLAQEAIKRLKAEEVALQGQAYNALGFAYQKAGKLKEAVLAYLHVDLLYSNVPAEHVEALENLVELFGKLGQRERAEEAAKILKERYGRTPQGS